MNNATHLSIGLALAATLCTTAAHAQWTDHISYGQVSKATIVDGKAIAANSIGAFYYDPSENYLGKLNKTNHLNSADITAIYADGSRLIVGYASGNIDVVDLSDYSTVNIPELSLSSAFTVKQINSIVRHGSRYYCGFSAGILEVDRTKEEIKSTWKIVGGTNVNVSDVCVSDGYIYAATTNGIYRANLSSNVLEDTRQWSLLPYPQTNISTLCNVGSTVFAAEESGDSAIIYRIGADSLSTLTTTVQNYRQMKSVDDKLYITRAAQIDTYDTLLAQTATTGLITTTAGAQLTNIQDCFMASDGRMAIADYNVGLVVYTPGVSAVSYLPNGPISNSLTQVLCTKYGVYVSGIGRNSANNSLYNPLYLSTLRDGTWSNVTSYAGRDAVYLAVDPLDHTQVYLSSWGTGIFKVETDGSISTNYNASNSTLTDIFNGSGYTRVDGLGFDRKHNLYTVSAFVSNGINAMTKDGNWYSYSYGNFGGWHSSRHITVTKNNNIWICGSEMQSGNKIVNTNGTPETDEDDLFLSTTDDSGSSQFVGTFSITDSDSGDDMGDRLTVVAEDRDGLLWVGTKTGLLTCDNDAKIFSNLGVTFSRVKVPRNDGTNLADYLLDGIEITDIAVDGANRKWIGTSTEGVYLVSSDGYTMLEHLTAENSSLFDNQIYSISVSPISGEVYILTAIGLQSYDGDATEPTTTLKEVDTYPNPASLSTGPGYVNITGLEFDSQVFITDVAGNRVFYSKSLGGMARWDMRRNGGARVVPGIYIVWTSSTDGTNKSVGKILIKD